MRYVYRRERFGVIYIFLLDRDLPANIDSSTAAEGLRPIVRPDSDLITFLQLDMQAANSNGVMTLSKESLHGRRLQSSKTILGRSRP